MASRAEALGTRSNPRPPWAYWHLLSLDAPTVATVWCCAFATSASVRLPLAQTLCLTAAVWVLYVGDRLQDARRTEHWQDLRERHWFHAEHHRVLLPLMLTAALLLALTMLREASLPLLRNDALLGLAAALYFLRIHLGSKFGLPPLPRPAKEVTVGSLFSLGVALPTLTRMPHPWHLALPVACFAAVCTLNCLIIEHYERALPLGSIAAASASLAGICGIACLLGSHTALPLLLLLATSSLLLLSLSLLPRVVSLLGFRVLADVALLTPLLLLWPR